MGRPCGHLYKLTQLPDLRGARNEREFEMVASSGASPRRDTL
jgi:hypothetical protein